MRVDYGARILRKYLERRGYVLVYQDRWKHRQRATQDRNTYRRSESDLRSEARKLRDRIEELEAEVVAHERVEQSLAERAIRAERELEQ